MNGTSYTSHHFAIMLVTPPCTVIRFHVMSSLAYKCVHLPFTGKYQVWSGKPNAPWNDDYASKGYKYFGTYHSVPFLVALETLCHSFSYKAPFLYRPLPHVHLYRVNTIT